MWGRARGGQEQWHAFLFPPLPLHPLCVSPQLPLPSGQQHTQAMIPLAVSPRSGILLLPPAAIPVAARRSSPCVLSLSKCCVSVCLSLSLSASDPLFPFQTSIACMLGGLPSGCHRVCLGRKGGPRCTCGGEGAVAYLPPPPHCVSIPYVCPHSCLLLLSFLALCFMCM